MSEQDTREQAYVCSTPCDPDCTNFCHEGHQPTLVRAHDVTDCRYRQKGWLPPDAVADQVRAAEQRGADEYRISVEQTAQALYEDKVGSHFPITWSELSDVEKVVWRRQARPAVDWCRRVSTAQQDEVDLARIARGSEPTP